MLQGKEKNYYYFLRCSNQTKRTKLNVTCKIEKNWRYNKDARLTLFYFDYFNQVINIVKKFAKMNILNIVVKEHKIQ